ncbi:carcinoembryonic antigen-related cell adhesion molecule 5-like isoform X2 [Scomber scombrus]|uniref:carcinoembryonic antigen-related cell adhesion molecule 5-like isoform X2 n=1 Tax=Scomber scombrus TaxID=13677 RepID=UPI002DD7C61D|nr:carcinoembryonic antigen-related cell adhesion molecule 5-like isoform X2 [Scomber scombrus]
MDILPLLCVVSVTFTGLTKGTGVLPDELTAAVGGEVMFTTTVTPPETPFVAVTWTFASETILRPIITYTSSVNNTAPEYEGRIIHYRSTGSLKLMDLTLNDIGEYRVTIISAEVEQFLGSTELKILVPISNVTVTASSTDLMEFSSVSLSCSSSGSSPSFLWMNGSSEVTASERVQFTDGGITLTIINVTRYDQGPYICRVSNAVSNGTSDPVNLSIHLPVSNIKVNASSTELVEFNSSVSLSCSSSGSSPSFLWMNGSSEVTASDRVQLTDGNSTLIITNVTRYDQGPFRCHAFNLVSNVTSDPVELSISYGPENIILKLSPSEDHYVEGSTISLSCSAVSRPSAQFQWFLNGDQLSDTGPELTLMNIKGNQSGNYSCQAFNNKTLRYQTSQPSAITVLERVSNVKVTASSTDLVEFNSSVSLSCSSSGSSPSFLWMNSSSEVTASERVQLTDGNSTLIITSVTRYDQGPLRCHVSNFFSNVTSDPVELSVSFGPENIILKLSPSEEHYVEGSNISLSCSAVSRPSAQFQWFLNGDQLSDTGPELTLMNIQESQSGNYSCQAFNNKTLRYQTSQPSAITVLEPVSNVKVTASSTDLVEFSSVSLSCSSSGSSLSFLWMNGSSEVTASERVQFTDGGRTVTIISVTRYDQGPFRCHVSNPVSDGTSDPVEIAISFGPVNIILNLSSSEEHYLEGSTINLSCSAVSRPSAQFQWLRNGDPLSDTGPELTLMNIQKSQSGNYSCQALNSKTLRYQTSQPSAITVLERVSDTSIIPSTQLIEGNSVNLTCDGAGSIFTREWMKDGSLLNQTDNMILYNTNRVLSFISLKKTDNGEYLCKISNPVSKDEANYSMIVNYGPENVQITGPSEINVKQTLTLTCSAASTPSASYTWILNGTNILYNSDVFTKNMTELTDSGSYTCRALNEITGRTSFAEHRLSVTENTTSTCSAGCIAGIVIACFVICGVAAGGYFIYKKQTKKSSNGNTTSRRGGGGQENRAYSGDQELNYADRFFNNNDGLTVHLGLQNRSQNQVNRGPAGASSPPSYDVHMQRMRRPAPQPDTTDATVYAQVQVRKK